ncbi:MAG: matrixin family metalloprotease [Gemmataceae bacterium]
MRKNFKPLLEILEDRLTPSTFGGVWPDPGHLTLSFVPDGADAGGTPSSLFHLLNAQAATSVWETAILRAFQTWAVNTNVNVGITADGGQPLGATGAVQGDTRFGDIRILAKPLQSSAVSTASPFSWTGTTWAGDVVLNSNYKFNIGGKAGAYDLFTIALHEAGHVFGIEDNTTDTQSAMYGSYIGPRTGLGGPDLADIQSLYGVREPDAFDKSHSNGSFATASLISNSASQLAFQADLSSLTDVDYYKIVSPLNLLPTSLNIQLKTSGVSLLMPTLSVYDASYHLLTSAVAYSSLTGDLNVTLNNINSFATYYFKVDNATPDVFGVGSYQIKVAYQSLTSLVSGVLSSPLDNTLTNTVLNLATVLLPDLANKTDQRFDYVHEASINLLAPQHYYQIQAPAASAAGPYVLHAIAWGTEVNGLAPVIHLFDGNGKPLSVQVLANGGGFYSVQIPNAPAGVPYYVEVAALNPKGNNNTGNFVLGIKFDASPPVVLDAIGSGALSSLASTSSATLNMAQNGLFHFVLAADNGCSSSSANVTMTVYDQAGHVVLTLNVQTGQPPITAVVYLQAGLYTIRYSAASTSGAFVPVNFWLLGEILSDPIGPYYTTTGSGSNSGTSSPSNSGGSYTYSGSSTGASQPHYY